jgi:protein-lysine N-methyltransferase EEF2KMT
MVLLTSLLAANAAPQATMVQEKVHATYTFANEHDLAHPVTLLESRYVISSAGTTGLRTWEAALHLGAYLMTERGRQHVRGKTILELGSGTGLVSLLCAKHLGAARVVATDGSEVVVDTIKTNMFLNELDEGSKMEAAALKWGFHLSEMSIEEDYANGSLDLILGADVVSWPRSMQCLQSARANDVNAADL